MTTTLPSHGAVILAAGASRRLGQSKQLLGGADGESLVHRAARLALATSPQTGVIVLGADADRVFAAVRDLPLRRIDCADWQRGMGASLRAGIAALAADVAGALVVLCDQPALDAAHLTRLCAAWRAHPARAAASAYAGAIGVPAILPRGWFGELGGLNGDVGARDLLARHRAEVSVVVNEALARDVDRAADLGVIDP